MRQVKAMGVALYLDHFGAGYSSVGLLQQLPVDGLKIDASFVSGLSGGDRSPVVRGILALAQSLGLEALADGIETESQAAVLLALDCAIGQGDFLSPALEPERAAEMLRRTHPGPAQA